VPPPHANCCLFKVLLILPPLVGASVFGNWSVDRPLRGGGMNADNFLPKKRLTSGNSLCRSGDVVSPSKAFKQALGDGERLVAEHGS
jgi:hypothetical protein